jgi:tryptophan synthase beta chain
VRKLAPTLSRDAIVIVNLSGRGDKDAPQVREILAQRAGSR